MRVSPPPVVPPAVELQIPTGTEAHGGARRRRNFLVVLGAVVALYVAGYGLLLRDANYLPYVTDNNESFSVLMHAANLYHFGVGQSFGLTDEAFSPDPAAHPYVYTHGGNFPRLYGFLLYVLGARTIESQITIATFTIGTLGLAALFTYFYLAAGLRFATLAALVFGTDYLYFAQWQVNSYRVWHTVFFFTALLLIHGVMRSKRRWLWYGLTYFNFACLVYFDFTFAVFLAVVAALYTLALLRHNRGVLLGVWAAQALGAVTSMGVLVAQDIAYLGLPAFLQDMTQTYLVRNNEVGDSADGMRSIDQLTAFYASHHVVFWQQFASSDPLRDPLYFLQAFFRSALQAATPLLSAVVLVLLVASLVAGLTSQRVGPWWRRTEQLRPVRVTALSLERHERAVYAVLGVAVFVTGLAFTLSETTFGQTSSLPGIVWVLPSALAALLVCGTLGPLPSRASSGRLPLGRIGLTVVVLCGILILVSQQRTLYYPGHESLARLGAWIPDWLARLAVLLTVVVAAVLVLFGSRRFLGAGVIRPLVVTYLACVTVGYAVTYFLVPGYVVSDYLDRMTPLVVYARDTAIVVVLDLLVTGVVTAVRALRGQPWTASGSTLLAGAALSLAGLCALLSLDWLGMQWQYLQLMPPTNLSYFQVLEQPQFRGASFALKAYAAPVVDATGQWAYFDRELDEGQVLLTEAGYAVVRDAKTYLWFADRDSNLAYAQPDYYLCFAPQYLDTAADLLSGRPQINCSANPLVDHALVQSQEFPRDRVVAMDPTGRDQWAIVKLDWDPPPYLRPLPDAGASTYVDVSSQANPSAVNVHVRYDTEQQEGKPLVDTLIRVYWGSDADECLLTTIRSAPTIQLPGDFWGFLRVTVIPRTADQSGKEYSSDRVLVGVPPFELPDTLHGGTQYVHAATLEEAEQQAEAAGTWSPGAGTFGNQSSGPVQPSLPPARAADGACQSDTPG